MKEQTYNLQSVANSSASDRAGFIRRTYAHLAVAILAFIAIEYYLVNSPFAASLASSMTGGMSWLVVIGLFMGVSYCLLYTSPSPRDVEESRMPSSA